MNTPLGILSFLVGGLVAVAPASLRAQAAASSAEARSVMPSAPSSTSEPVAPDSPRASVSQFLELARLSRWDEASRFLEIPRGVATVPPVLARRLKAVLDRHAWIELGTLSPRSTGNLDDGLPPALEQIAEIPGPAGVPEPVRLVRRDDPRGEARWVFSESTVRRIDVWYSRLGGRWIYETLPEWLLRPGPRHLLWWQWIALPVLFFVALALGYVLSRGTRAILLRLARRTAAEWDDQLLERVVGPLTLAWTLALLVVVLPLMALAAPAERFLYSTLRAGFFVVFFWALFRTTDVLAEILMATRWAAARPASRALVPLGRRIVKVLVLAIAVIAVLAELGYPVASLVAGLGIGGLALALAAQKTVENLFGAFSIGVDQPFREGDTVKIDDFVGTVEAIGLRSTRIRTPDRTLISMPNGKLADSRIESLSARDRFRLATEIGLVYSTRVAQLREILDALRRVLVEHPKVSSKDPPVVKLKAFGDSALVVEVMAWFEVPDWATFQNCREEVLLAFMEVVERAGSAFAYPTRTVHLVDERPRAPSESLRATGAAAASREPSV